MSDLIIVHRSFQSTSTLEKEILKSPTFLMWETCRRQIFFSETSRVFDFDLTSLDEVYFGLDAEEFLVQVLCGLKSPLIGETEVFGQFKNWWQELSDLAFKEKYNSQIQQIYSVVKKTRDENLCGLGSQSYGSLLRKKISDVCEEKEVVDFLGAGQLVEEIVPWLQKKWSYRIWARDVDKVKAKDFSAGATNVLQMDQQSLAAKHIIVAAPLNHEQLSQWIQSRKQQEVYIYDFRKDSMTFKPMVGVTRHYHLDHFTTEVAQQAEQIQSHIKNAQHAIALWKIQAEKKAVVRPFGWDDL